MQPVFNVCETKIDVLKHKSAAAVGDENRAKFGGVNLLISDVFQNSRTMRFYAVFEN